MVAEMKNLADAIEDMRNGTYDFTNNGECIQCGACCSNYLPMTQKEIATIRRYIKKHNIKAYRHLFPMSKEAFDMTCPFMDDSKLKEKCRIYPVRPEICRQFNCSKDKKPFDTRGQKYDVVDVRRKFFWRMKNGDGLMGLRVDTRSQA